VSAIARKYGRKHTYQLDGLLEATKAKLAKFDARREELLKEIQELEREINRAFLHFSINM
jgi:hypothetical protein